MTLVADAVPSGGQPGLRGVDLVQLVTFLTLQPGEEAGHGARRGLFADLAVTLSGLPSGTTIVVNVTARNEAGETQPSEVTVVVP